MADHFVFPVGSALQVSRELNFCVFVFSYNRGAFLRNCMDSIARHLPTSPVVIMDDGSEDPFTVQVLGELADSCRIVRAPQNVVGEKKTGGLSDAMNRAMEISRDSQTEYVLFIQDDMQIVRQIDHADWERILAYFSKNENTIQLSTNFIRRLSADDFWGKHELDPSGFAYIRQRSQERGKSNFSDTGFFSVERFFSLYSEFVVGEGANGDKARRLGLVCGRAVYPFTCWLPYPISFRGKKRKVQHSLMEWMGGAGYYPINPMQRDDVVRLMMRKPSELPLMEDYLSAPSAPRQDIWSTGGGEYNLVARGGLPALAWKWARWVSAKIRR